MKDKSKCDKCWVSSWAAKEKRMESVWNEKEGWQWKIPIEIGSIREIRLGTFSSCKWRCPFDHVQVLNEETNRACLTCPVSRYIKDKKIKKWVLGKDGWVENEEVMSEEEEEVSIMDEMTVEILIRDHCKGNNCPYEFERFMQDG